MDLRPQLQRFAEAHISEKARVGAVESTTGHAGFSYFFNAIVADVEKSYFIRVSPPGARQQGTADLLRQVCVLNALDPNEVPHVPVLWSGDDPTWFGGSYFITERLHDEVLHAQRIEHYSLEDRRFMARQAVSALAALHRTDVLKCGYLGEFGDLEEEVVRWDRLVDRADNKHLMVLQPQVRDELLRTRPPRGTLSVCHGDFQWANLIYSTEGRLLAIVDWELAAIAPPLADLGWLCAFNTAEAWVPGGMLSGGFMPGSDELEGLYQEAARRDTGDLPWFTALALYKFAIISGFNLMLHRTGRRPDEFWEWMAQSIAKNLEYASARLELQDRRRRA